MKHRRKQMNDPVRSPAQTMLSGEQIGAFYHDEFVEDQTRHFISLVPRSGNEKVVIDVGGGCGFFAKRLGEQIQRTVRVLDLDPASIDACERAGVQARRDDALNPHVVGDEEVVCFNLILHHLVGDSERVTRSLQRRALDVWRAHARAVFVNEYIYESYVGNLSGRLIFEITKSKLLSSIGRAVSGFIPSLKANTFGVGVRFRAHKEWRQFFESAGYRVTGHVVGESEPVSPAWRLLLIKCIRRDSFLLEPRIT